MLSPWLILSTCQGTMKTTSVCLQAAANGSHWLEAVLQRQFSCGMQMAFISVFLAGLSVNSHGMQHNSQTLFAQHQIWSFDSWMLCMELN
jgi:phosphatidylglycerophosphate synthase